MQPKPIRETDKDYKSYIISKPCLVWNNECLGDIVAHHSVSRGSGGSDYKAVPLCMRHHNDVHNIGWLTFQEYYNINFDKEIIRLLIGYIKKIKCDYKSNKVNKKRTAIENALSDAESWGPGEAIE